MKKLPRETASVEFARLSEIERFMLESIMLRLIDYTAGITVVSCDAPRVLSIFKKRLQLKIFIRNESAKIYFCFFLKRYQNCIFIQELMGNEVNLNDS